MIDLKKIKKASYKELEASLMELSKTRRAGAKFARIIQARMDELAAEEKATKTVAAMSPAEREAMAVAIKSGSSEGQ